MIVCAHARLAFFKEVLGNVFTTELRYVGGSVYEYTRQYNYVRVLDHGCVEQKVITRYY